MRDPILYFGGMDLTPSERANCKKEIGQRLSVQSWTEIDLVLEEFGLPITDSWNGDNFSYVIEMLKGASDIKIVGLASHLNIELAKDGVLDPPRSGTTDNFASSYRI